MLARHGRRQWIETAGIAPNWTDHVLLNGWIGVDLFFVLSGYLIARILVRHDPASLPRRVPSYLWRRFLRIAPAYYAVLLATVCGAMTYVDGIVSSFGALRFPEMITISMSAFWAVATAVTSTDRMDLISGNDDALRATGARQDSPFDCRSSGG